MATTTLTEIAEFTINDVAAHQHKDDLWIAIHGEVFDVSKYINDHPGGADIFSEIAGADGSEAFDNAQHSEDAMQLKTSFRVGRLKGKDEQKRASKTVRLVTSSARTTTAPRQILWLSQTLIVLAIVLGLAAIEFGFSMRTSGTPLPAIPAFPELKYLVCGAYWQERQALGFTEGVLFSVLLFALLAYLTYRPFHATMERWTGQWRYESHLKLPKMPPKPGPSNRHGWLDPSTFQKLALARKECLRPNTYRFVFSLPKSNMVLGLPVGQHISIRGEVNGTSVSRSYTPVSSNADLGILELVVRCYDNGTLTNGYLKQLGVGDGVDFRGPKGGIRYRRGMAAKIGMVAGGTGITPMYQLIRAICEDPRDTTEVSLIYANRSEQDILLKDQLDRFARRYPRIFKVLYVLDQGPPEWQGGRGFVTREMMKASFAAPSPEHKVAVCGPPPMVESARRSLGEMGYKLPGPIAKPTDEILCF